MQSSAERKSSMANARTRATERYHRKVGLVNKSFKLRKEDADAFKSACEAAGISQASQITKMIRTFVAEQKNNKLEGDEAGISF